MIIQGWDRWNSLTMRFELLHMAKTVPYGRLPSGRLPSGRLLFDTYPLTLSEYFIRFLLTLQGFWYILTSIQKLRIVGEKCT